MRRYYFLFLYFIRETALRSFETEILLAAGHDADDVASLHYIDAFFYF